MMIAAAMVVGFVLLGAIAERLSRLGIPPLVVAVSGMIAFMIVQALVILEATSWLKTVWVLFGIFGTTGILPYAVLSQSFPLHLSGRVNTGVNLQVFIAAFSAQWGIGAIINLWPIAGDGGYSPAGYQASAYCGSSSAAILTIAVTIQKVTTDKALPYYFMKIIQKKFNEAFVINKGIC